MRSISENTWVKHWACWKCDFFCDMEIVLSVYIVLKYVLKISTGNSWKLLEFCVPDLLDTLLIMLTVIVE